MYRSRWTVRVLLLAAAMLALAALLLRLLSSGDLLLQEHPLDNPDGAVITALAAHPDDPNIRLASTTLGIFFTRDHGETWERADLPPSWSTPAEQLLYDPGDPDTAYALGTFGLGISRDGGETWNVAPPPPGASRYLGIVASPASGSLYIVAPNGLLRSDDRGVSWTALPIAAGTGPVRTMAAHPDTAGILIAGTERGFARSTDGGESWQIPTGGPAQAVDWLALKTSFADELIALTPSGIYSSEDEGNTWAYAGELAALTQPRPEASLSPIDRGTLALWSSNALEQGSLSGVPQEVDLLGAHAEPATGTGLLATSKGIYETADGALTWELWATELPAAPIEILAVAPGSPGRIYAISPFGLATSEDGSQTWQNRTLPETGPSEIRAIAVDPLDALTVYLLTGDGSLFETRDGGQRWNADGMLTEPQAGVGRLTAVRDAQGASVPCLLSDQLYCLVVRDDARWQVSGPPEAAARPIGLLAYAGAPYSLILDDGTVYRAADPVSGVWQAAGGADVLQDALATAYTYADGTGLTAVSISGDMYSLKEGGWRLVAGAPEDVQDLLQPAVLAATASDRPVALANTGEGLMAWEASGRVAGLETGAGRSAQAGTLVAGSAMGATVYRLSAEGALSRIVIIANDNTRLALWLGISSGILVLVAFVLWGTRNAGAQLTQWHPPRVRRKHTIPIQGHSSRSDAEMAAAGDDTPGSADAVLIDIQETPCTETRQDIEPTRSAETPATSAAVDMPASTAEPGPVPATVIAAGKLIETLCDRLGADIRSQETRGAFAGYMVDTSQLRMTLPATLPLVITGAERIDAGLAAEIQSLAADMGAVSPFTVVVHASASPGTEGATPQHTGDSGKAASGLIVIDTDDLSQLLASEDTASALGRLIQRDVPLGQISPFVASGPVPLTMFYGREYEIKALMRGLYDKSLAIVGGRRIGKTSFLSRVHQELLQSQDFVPVYVDCHHVSDDTGFLHTLSLMGGVPVESASVEVLRRVVMRLRAQQESPGQVVLELDEVDNLLRYDMAVDMCLFRVLRALSDEGLCRFVLCGERVLAGALQDASLPLQTSFRSLRLGYLTQDDATRLVREPLAGLGIAVQDPEQTVAEIVALSGRHPNILQSICQMLVERVAGREERIILAQDLAAVSQSAAFRDLFFEVSWGNATTLERLISVLMAQKQVFSPGQVRLALEKLGIRVPDQELALALQGLVLTSLIVPRGTEYAFISDAFTRILGETGFAQGFRDSLAEMLLEEQSEP